MCAVLIIGTSLAPSPMASVIFPRYYLTKETTSAFWMGSNLQQTTALHFSERAANYFLHS